MNIPSICHEPGCGGRVDQQRKKCLKCGVLYDDNPEAQAYLREQSGEGGAPALVTAVLSALSRRDIITDELMGIGDIVAVSADMQRGDPGGSRYSLSATLGGGIIKMPRVQTVDRLSHVDFALRTPLSQRTCSNVRWDKGNLRRIACEESGEPAGPDHLMQRTRLYWKVPAILKKLPAMCRLEDIDDPASGEATKMFVPDKGFCKKCGTPFNFLPLEKGLKIDQFRVDGQFACGGDGMLYHGMDTELGVPVVIKALHNADNTRSAKIASHEIAALVGLQGQAGVLRVCGYKNYNGRLLIITEWLNGSTLFEIRADNGPLPVEVGLSYLMGAIAAVRVGHEISPTILHLDIKPQNFIVLAPGDHLKAIDYGGSMIDGKGDLVRTLGFSAPELYADEPINGGRKRHPSKASDVYALGRLFCFLSLDFTMKGKYQFALPSPSELHAFAEMESLYRFVRRMTAINPDERLTMDEAYDAAAALRNEVIALKERRSMPTSSRIFFPDLAKATALNFRNLPLFVVDAGDEAAHEIEEALNSIDPNSQHALLEKARLHFPESKEAKLRLAALDIDTGELDHARRVLETLAKKDPFDGRSVYHLGRLALAEGNHELAARCFDACYSIWPAEAAIKLPNALCAELLGQHARASRLYETAAWMNPDYIAGPFGWARVALKEGDRATAMEAFNRVPRTSWAFKQAVIGRVEALLHILSTASAKGVGLVELEDAAVAAGLVIAEGESFESLRVTADVLEAAIAALKSRALPSDKTVRLLGVPLVRRRLRKAAAAALVKCASFVADRAQRIALIDESRRVAGYKFF
jgi:serine/threonine-protein kinase PknG